MPSCSSSSSSPAVPNVDPLPLSPSALASAAHVEAQDALKSMELQLENILNTITSLQTALNVAISHATITARESPIRRFCKQLRTIITGRLFYFASSQGSVQRHHEHIVLAGAQGRAKNAVHIDISDDIASVRLIGNVTLDRQGRGPEDGQGEGVDLAPQTHFVATTVSALLFALNSVYYN